MLGYTPREVDEMTLWEFKACIHGYSEANKTSEDAPPPMEDDDLVALGIDGFSLI